MYITEALKLLLAVQLVGLRCYGKFVATTDPMEDLYNLEVFLVQELERSIREQQNILTLLSGRYEQAALSLSNTGNRDAFISNPINCFAMLRRLSQDWPKTLSLLPHNADFKLTLPTEEELVGGALALSRLQNVYGISVETLARGGLPGTHRKAVMTANDCVMMAQYYFTNHDYPKATDWLIQALQKVFKDYSCPPGLVLEHLVLTTCFEGKQEESSLYLRELLNRYPRYSPPSYLLEDFNQAITESCEALGNQRAQLRGKSVPELEDNEIDEYHGACRGAGRVSGKLQCHLVNYNNPWLRLRPAKLEELHLDPPVVMLHDAISDQEIDYIKSTSFPLMQRAQVQMPDGEGRYISYRTSLVAWLPVDDELGQKLDRRMAALTGLDMASGEQLQVSKYGMVGEYVLHLDALQQANLSQGDPDGNRLATFMFYLSDVSLGGHTVFPDLGLSVRPHKGTALFWYNLNHDGSRDLRMRHASCPVIVGSKWVLNKWIHEAGQEFRERPPCFHHINGSRKYFYL